MKKIYLFRHGETDYNKQRKTQSTVDIPLNETGLIQAKNNANFFMDKGVEHIYSSPLIRAIQTAKVVADLLNIEIEPVDDLAEIDLHFIDGLTYDEVDKLLGVNFWDLTLFSRDDGMDFRVSDECETKREARERFGNAVLNICKNTPYNTIGISAHGFVLSEFIRYCDFEDDSHVKNCEIIEAECDGDNIKIIKRIII